MISSVQKLVFSVATYYLSHISNKIHTYLFFLSNESLWRAIVISFVFSGGDGDGAEGDQDGGGG